MKRSIVSYLCIAFCSCAPHSNGNVTAHARLIKLSNDTIELLIRNEGKEPVCVSAADLSPYYGKIRIFGKSGEIFRTNIVNRELQTYKSVDVADGLLVSQEGREKKVLIPLSEFPVRDGIFVSGSLEFSYATCSSLFDGSNAAKSMRVTF
ncbi:hypothetical protein [Sphingomonas adhaesiva]|uniref:hypothetical protein n=1 Tax=Sphingomonas adhaesiva TaxID=28212 RepID=UPI002FF73C4A